MKKRCLSLLLAAAMLCAMLPVQAFAADPVPTPETAGSVETAVTPAEMSASPETADEAQAVNGVQPAPQTSPETASAPEAAPQATPETAEQAQATPETAAGQQPEVQAAVPQLLLSSPATALTSAPVEKLRVYFRETGGVNFIQRSDLKLSDDYMWVALPASMYKADLSTYTFELTGPDGAGPTEITGIQFGDADGKNAIWSQTFTAPGAYTVTIKQGDRVIARGDINIVKFLFETGTGGYFGTEPGKTEHASYYQHGDLYASFLARFGSIPKVTATVEGQDMIGWAKAPGVTQTSDLLSKNSYDIYTIINTPGVESDGKGTYTVYAAYGTREVYAFKLLNGEQEVTLGEEVTMKPAAGVYTPEDYQMVLTLRNTGNMPLAISQGSTLDFLDVRYLNEDKTGGSSTTLAAGKDGQIVLTPKAGQSPNTYGGTVGFFVDMGGRTYYQFQVKFSVTSSTLVVTPPKRTKEYGVTIAPGSIPDDEVTILYDKTDVKYEGTLSSLGITLDSAGFRPGAEVGSYQYELTTTSTTPALTVRLANDPPKVEVTQATPKMATYKTPVVHVGEPLSSAKLSASFVNPNNDGMGVSGDLVWSTPDPEFSSAVEGTFPAKWTFTPTGSDIKNYKEVSGQIDVTVTQKPASVLTPDPANEKVVTYDGKAHGLRYTPDRAGILTVQYRPVGSAGEEGWTNAQPKAAGSYEVKVDFVPASDEYAPARLTDTLTIEQKEITGVSVNVSSKTYDGSTEAAVTYFSLNGIVGNDRVTARYTARFESALADPQARVLITVQELTGIGCENYKLPAVPEFHTYAGIFLRKLTIVPKTFSKGYGETLYLQSSDFAENIRGLVEGEDAGLEFLCKGALADTGVGSYAISANLTNPNYTFGNNVNIPQRTLDNCGTVTVTKVKPVVNGDLSVGAGHKGCQLDHVALEGGFVNPNNAAMPVPGTLRWKESGKTLPDDADQCSAAWVFEPKDTANYESPVEGTAVIQLLSKEPVHIKVAPSTTVTYDGKGHTPEVWLEEPLESTCTLEFSPLGTEDWTIRQPVDAGTYAVRITAYPPATLEESYTTNQVTAQLTILPAPLVSTVPAALEVPEGTPLSSETVQKAFKDCFTFRDEPVNEGTLAWLEPNSVITADDLSFVWIFVPESGNYTTVSGTMTFTLAPDTRTVKAAIYNLPAALNYQDYAVVDIKESDIRAGDTVTFFKDAACTDPISNTVPVTVEDVANGKLAITLDGDALAPREKGSIYARITSSQKNEPSEQTYHAEPGFALEDNGGGPAGSIMVHPGIATEVTARLLDKEGEETIYSVDSIAFALTNAADIAELNTAVPADEQKCTLTGKSQGSGATLTVTVKFRHPDTVGHPNELITLTETAAVACAGTIDALPGKNNVTDVKVDAAAARDALETDDDRDALDAGHKITYALDVVEASASTSQEKQEQTDVENAAESIGYTVGCHLDITITRFVDDSPTGGDDGRGKITDTDKPLTITIEIPKGVLEDAMEATGNDPEFAVYRVHDGAVDRLPDLDGNGNDTVTIATDKFSLYSIVYHKAPPKRPEPPAEDDEEEEETAAAPIVRPVVTIPQTADESAPALWRFAFLASALGLCVTGFCLIKRRRKNK